MKGSHMQDYAGSITINQTADETTIDVGGVDVGILPTFSGIDGGVSFTLGNGNLGTIVGVFEGIVTKLKALGSTAAATAGG